MLTEEQKSRLNPKQLAIAEKWEREREQREIHINEMEAAQAAGDGEAFLKAAKAACKTDSMCEHERSIWSRCGSCEEIERLLWPEQFPAEEEDEDE